MRSAQITALGGPDRIAIVESPVPAPGPSDVLIRVSHGSVNHVDTFVRSGAWPTPLTLPLTVGRDAVGTVSAVGAAAEAAFEVGQSVWTNSLGFAGRDGALAEYVTAPVERVFALPAGVAAVDMAALAHPGSTAHLALFRHGGLQLDDHLLVVGAGGNIGSIAVQLAHFAGADVTAVARPHHHDRLRRLGADRVLDLEALRHGDLAREVDVVVDAAGVNDLVTYSSLAAHGARIVLVAGMGTSAEIPVGAVYLKGLHLTGFAISHASVADLAGAAAGLGHSLSRHGLVPPDVIVRPLAEVADAHRDIEDDLVRGKQVIEVRSADPNR